MHYEHLGMEEKWNLYCALTHVCWLQGVRAFLPIYNLVQHSTESPIEHLKEYVS